MSNAQHLVQLHADTGLDDLASIAADIKEFDGGSVTIDEYIGALREHYPGEIDDEMEQEYRAAYAAA